MVTALLRTKLHRPRTTGVLVPRLRAGQLLDGPLDGSLTLVSAPAGYGKTTVVAQWLESRAEAHAWLSLDPTDSAIDVFLRYVVEAFRTRFPDLGSRTLDLLKAPTPVRPDVLAASLAEDLDAVTTPFVLVLDDYQRIRDPEIHELLGELLRRMPPLTHLVIVTRRDPPLPLATLRAHGEVREVRAKDLRFSRSETARLLDETAGLSVGDEVLDNLEREFEGWIVGLRLACLALSPTEDSIAFLTGLHGGLPAVREYLLHEVLARQSAEVRNWMLSLSLLDRFCAPLCEAIHYGDAGPPCNGLDGESFLRTLEEGGLFTIALDTYGQWNRYHHLFQGLLQTELTKNRDPGELATLHARASRWFADHGAIEEAMHHATAADDPGFAADLVVRNRHEPMNRETWHVLIRWIDALPSEEVETNAVLLSSRAWASSYFHRLDEGRELITRAEAQAPGRDETPESSAVWGEIDAYHCLDAYLRGDASEVIARGTRAMEQLSAEASALRGYAVAAVGWAYQASGQPARSLEFMSKEVERAQVGDAVFDARLMTGFSLVHFREGTLSDVLPVARRLLALGTEHDLPESTVFARSFLGWAHYLRQEPDAAIPYLEAVVRDRVLARKTWFANCAFALALIHEVRGNGDEASRLVELVREHALEWGVPAVVEDARAFAAEIALRRGRIAEAVAWARGFDPDRYLTVPYFYLPQMTLAKIRLAQATAAGRREAAVILDGLRSEFEASHDRRRLGDVLALRALVAEAMGDDAEVCAAIRGAVSLTAPGGAIRPFLDLGPPMEQLLRRMPSAVGVDLHRRRILEEFRKTATPLPRTESMAEPLTNREQDVLELISERFRDKEVAARLVISPATVKSHLKGLYQKLGVGNRRDAVSRARALGLLHYH